MRAINRIFSGDQYLGKSIGRSRSPHAVLKLNIGPFRPAIIYVTLQIYAITSRVDNGASVSINGVTRLEGLFNHLFGSFNFLRAQSMQMITSVLGHEERGRRVFRVHFHVNHFLDGGWLCVSACFGFPHLAVVVVDKVTKLLQRSPHGDYTFPLHVDLMNANARAIKTCRLNPRS